MTGPNRPRLLLMAALSLAPFFIGCASEVLKGQVAEADARRSAVETELSDAQNRLAQLDAENRNLLSEQTSLVQERQRQRAEFAELSERFAQRERQFESDLSEQAAEKNTLLAENERLRTELDSTREELALRSVALERTPTEIILPNVGRQTERFDFGDDAILPPRGEGEKIVVELQDRLLFDPESGKLTDIGKRRLCRVAEVLSERFPNRPLKIEGHLAPLGTGEGASESPLERQYTSLRKAAAAADVLIAENVAASRNIILAGCGDACPLVGGASAEAQERNARIELSPQ